MAMQTQLSADEAAVLAAGGDPTLVKGGAGGCPTSQRGADGGLSGGASGGKEMTKAKAKKAEDEIEGEEEVEEEEEDKAKKSEIEADIISADDLIKSMEALEAASNGFGGDTDRRAELAKGLAAGTLSKAEREELQTLLDGEKPPADESFAKGWQEEFAAEDVSGEDYDVSAFLERQTAVISKSMESVRSEVISRGDAQLQFNRALAKSLRNVGEVTANQQTLIKSLLEQNSRLNQRLGIVENTPQPRKSRQTPRPQPLQKSQSGEAGGEGLNRAEIMEGLNQLMVKSRENSFIAPCGEPVDRAVALYESYGKITRGMLQDVATVLGKEIQV